MDREKSWRELLLDAMDFNKESLVDIVSNTMSDAEMDVRFDAGYGGTEGIAFTVWTANHVYFPICYDGAEWVGSVARNPDGQPTEHQGGG